MYLSWIQNSDRFRRVEITPTSRVSSRLSKSGPGRRLRTPCTPKVESFSVSFGMYVPVLPLLRLGIFVDWKLQVGRTTHPDNLGGRLPVGPSANKSQEGMVFWTPKGPQPFVDAREMTQEDIDDTISDYVHAAKCAIAAGFDGVEVHAANGYLLDQFICDNINVRTDKYGGSTENRARFVIEVTDAVVAAIGADRVGIRFSPFGFFQGAQTSDIIAHYGYPISQLGTRGLAYIHLVEPRSDLFTSDEVKMNKLADVVKAHGKADTVLSLRPFRDMATSTPLITCGSYDDTNASEPVESGDADAVAIGRWFISNPDLPERLAKGYPLTKYDRNTFYSQGREGYTDYPFHTVEAKI
jgi:N-ethylmaleimide reductase